MERKKIKNMTLRMSPELYQKIEQEARDNESNCTQIIRSILCRHYSHEGVNA